MKQKSQKQKKADKAFVKKISSLNIGGKFVAATPPHGVPKEIHIHNCPCCKDNHVLKYVGMTEHPRHDDSQEHTVTA